MFYGVRFFLGCWRAILKAYFIITLKQLFNFKDILKCPNVLVAKSFGPDLLDQFDTNIDF